MEVFISYLFMAIIIACIYYSFRIVNCVVNFGADIFQTLLKPEPNRKRRFKNVNEIFILTKAANEFGFILYDKTNPIEITELKNRFRNKVKIAHPDHGGSTEEFIRIKKAYDALLPHTTF